MLIPAAQNLSIEISVLAEAEDSSAKLAATMVGDFTDLATVSEFAKGVDVITFDHEHVPLTILEELEASGVSVQPPARALAHAQNKLLMRRALEKIAAPNPIWRAVRSEQELEKFLAEHGPEVIVKTPIGGYDGKGVRVVSDVKQVSDWLAPEKLSKLGGELLAEQKVEFVRELAQLSARSPSGEFRAMELVETRQEKGVCSEVIAPAPDVSAETIAKAADIARSIAEALAVTGNFAVEMFEGPTGELVVNELAMRPHNSGHFSIEGATTSQFEQHLRAVLDLPLGETELLARAAVMVNLLGISDEKDYLENYRAAMAAVPEAKIHSYGKKTRIGRKLGHITVLGQDWKQALLRAERARDLLLGRS